MNHRERGIHQSDCYHAYIFAGEHGLHLRYLLQATAGTGTNPSQLKLFCRRIGDHANVVVFELQGFSAENDRPLIGESVVPRPQNFPPAGLVISFTVSVSVVVIHGHGSSVEISVHGNRMELQWNLRTKDTLGAERLISSYVFIFKAIIPLHSLSVPRSIPLLKAHFLW